MSSRTQRLTSFRADIEGLRGVAVALVVIFHFKLLGLNGGFIGVDIFFVISGFLMTHILFNERFEWTANGIFTYYKKRFWRIAPAYYVLLIFIGVLFISYPYELHIYDFRKSFLTSLIFAYNVHAPSGAGYFEVAAQEKPFLHLWSLGVEVQFYLLWPLLLFFVKSFSFRTKVLSILSISLLSFISSAILSVHDPDVAYFSILTRLWQFGLGSLAALMLLDKPSTRISHNLFVSLISTACLTTVLYYAFYAPQANWPSWPAIPVTLASALLLWLGTSPTNIPTRLLSAAPFRWLGKISYSLYLVHWPVVVLLFLVYQGEVPYPIALSGALACIGFAVLLYWGVERPYRTLGKKQVRLFEVRIPVLVSAVVLSLFTFIQSDTLLPAITSPNALKVTLHQKQNSEFNSSVCGASATADLFSCDLGDSTVAPDFFVWGDSHARALGLGLHQELGGAKKRAILLQGSGCTPYLESLKKQNSHCNAYTEQALDYYFRKYPTLKTVLLVSRWTYSLDSERLAKKYRRRSSEILLNSRLPEELAYLEKSIQLFEKKDVRVILVAQAPETKSASKLKKCRMAYIYETETVYRDQCLIDASDDIEVQYARDNLLRLAAAKYDHVEFADVKSLFCDGATCSIAGESGVYLHDNDHLTPAGASKVVRDLLLPRFFHQ